MCIGSNWVNEAQDLKFVTKFEDLPNSLIPSTDYASHAGRVRDQQRAGGQGVRQEEPQEFQNGESRVSR